MAKIANSLTKQPLAVADFVSIGYYLFMAEKDVAEKTLEAYNDVFADIVNVLLFDGNQVVSESDLVDDTTVSQYKVDGKLHSQERDVAKFWKSRNIKICLYGLENQTAIDNDMPLRVLGYDGAAYRAQLLNSKKGKKKERYPVITLVLYFGEERWKKLSLSECVDIPEELKSFVNDYKVNAFEIAWLDDETVAKFKSDFKIVADYFVQVRKNKDYVPSNEVINHVHEMLTLMSVLTRDNRFEEFQNLSSERKEEMTMCDVLDRAINKGVSKGIDIGKAEGIDIGKAEGIGIGKAEGIGIGFENATNKLMSLFASLYSSGRAQDAQRATTDREYLNQLLAEFQQ